MEDILIFKAHRRRPQILRQIEDDLNSLGNSKMNSNCYANGRQPQLERKMEDELNILGKWKTPYFIL